MSENYDKVVHISGSQTRLHMKNHLEQLYLPVKIELGSLELTSDYKQLENWIE